MNRQAGAPFEALFERAVGFDFFNASEGRAVLASIDGGLLPLTSSLLPPNCTLQMNRAWDKRRPLATLVHQHNAAGTAGQHQRCPVLHVKGNMYFAPLLERIPRAAPAARWLRTRGLGCSDRGDDMLSGVQRFFGATSRHWYMPRAVSRSVSMEAPSPAPSPWLCALELPPPSVPAPEPRERRACN